MASGSDPPELPRGLIGRTGTPSGKGARLPSIKGPRDLTLGGVQKRVFTPNIPTRRNKSSESGTKDSGGPGNGDDKQKRPEKSGRGGRGGRGGGDRGRGGGDRGRGRGRGRGTNVIQTHSLFEQGPSEKTHRPSSGSDYISSGIRSGGSGGGSGSGSKVTVKREDKLTEEVLDHLLRDDFISGHADAEDDPTLIPVRLPLEVKQEVKSEQDHTKIKVKSEPKDTGEDVKPAGIHVNTETFGDTQLESLVSCSDIFTNSAKSEMGELMFFQLPDTLPGLPLTTDEEFKGKKSTEKKDAEKEKSVSDKLAGCSLDDFSEGLIGKLVIRKSGRVQMLLGNTYLDVNTGAPCGFLQDLVSVRTNGDRGDVSILGHIEQRLVCTPDFEALLDNS